MNITLSEKTPAGAVALSFSKERGTRMVNDTTLRIGGIETDEITLRKLRILVRKTVRHAREQDIAHAALPLAALSFPNAKVSDAKMVELIATEALMASYEHSRKTDTTPVTPSEFSIIAKATGPLSVALARGVALGEAVNACRELANTPGGDITPRGLAKAAQKAVEGLPVSVTTLGRKEMEKAGMGAVIGVGKGSSEEPTFTILEYKGAAGAPIVLAGKGITFDSGGLNIKSESGMYEMHMDMSGAAAVIHAVALAARLKIKKHVIGLVPSAENMPGNNAYRPGDILTSLSGKTIEVLNTDAEGRLILADALTYAKRLKPSVVVDVATLTGAAMVALGLHASAVMSRDAKLASELVMLGEESGDYLWPLPLWDEYEEQVKGTFADVANVPGNSPGSRYGGAINGGMFLWQFAKEFACPWAHLDIAPRMTSVPSDELAKGAAGAPVRLLAAFIESWQS